MRNLFVGGSMLLASVAAASAADLPVRTAAPAPVMVAALPYNWSGFYVGLNAGAAWSSGCTNYTLVSASNWPTTCGGNDNAQFTGGAQVGYNLQSGSFVYGIEADINGLGNSNSSARTFFYNDGVKDADGHLPGKGPRRSRRVWNGSRPPRLRGRPRPVLRNRRSRLGERRKRSVDLLVGWKHHPAHRRRGLRVAPWRRERHRLDAGRGHRIRDLQQLDGPRRVPLRRSRQRGQFLGLHRTHLALARTSASRAAPTSTSTSCASA